MRKRIHLFVGLRVSILAPANSKQNTRTLLPLGLGLWTEYGAYALVKNVLQPFLRECTALQVFDRTNLLGHAQALWIGDGRELTFLELLNGACILAQVQLGPDQNDGRIRAMVIHLGKPFGANILEGGRVDQ